MAVVSFVFLHQAKRFCSPSFFCSGFPCHCNSLKLTAYGEMLRVLPYTFFAFPPPLLMDKSCTINWVQFCASTLRAQLWNVIFPYMLQTKNAITDAHVKHLCITSFLSGKVLHSLFLSRLHHWYTCSAFICLLWEEAKISLRNCPIWIWFLQQLG